MTCLLKHINVSYQDYAILHRHIARSEHQYLAFLEVRGSDREAERVCVHVCVCQRERESERDRGCERASACGCVLGREEERRRKKHE